MDSRTLARGVALLCALAATGLAAAAGPARCAADDGLATIKPGAWELGFNGAFLSREGSVTSTIEVFTNRFWMPGGVPVSAGASIGYARVSDLDRADIEASAAAYKRLTKSTAYVYIGVAGGLSQEWIGSFSQVRYPIGFDAGIKALVSRRAAITVSYKFRRLLNDPVADYSEHRFVAGISIMFRNGRGDPR